MYVLGCLTQPVWANYKRQLAAEKVGGARDFCHFPAQDVFLERPVSQVVDLDSPAQLNCSANGSVSSIEWRRGQTVLTGSGRLTVAQGGIRISATQWADIGEYSCVATFMGREFSASATLNITGS